MARLHQAGCLQSRNRLADYRSTDALGMHDRGLGRQLVAALDQPVTDLLGEFPNQLLSEDAELATGARLRCQVVPSVYFPEKLRPLSAPSGSPITIVIEASPAFYPGTRHAGSRLLYSKFNREESSCAAYRFSL